MYFSINGYSIFYEIFIKKTKPIEYEIIIMTSIFNWLQFLFWVIHLIQTQYQIIIHCLIKYYFPSFHLPRSVYFS